MGLFGALNTSVAGMRAQSYALENISGNIANSQTTAFKRIDTSFMDMIPDTGNSNQVAGSVVANSRSTNTVRGDVQDASVATYMAINGDGFFAVQKPSSFSDNNPQFAGVESYTRRGDFTLDKNGYLVNGAGYYLEGIPIDSTTGNVTGSTPQVLKFGGDFLPAQPTTSVTYRANLARYPLTNKYDPDITGSELLNVGDFATNPRIIGTPPAPYLDNAEAGGAVNNMASPAIPITGGTKLSGTAPADAITTSFAVNDVINVNGKTITFVATGGRTNDGAGNYTLGVDQDINSLLGTIDLMTGNTGTPSAVVSGKVTLHTGIAADLDIDSTAAGFGALGFSTTVPTSVNRLGGGTGGAGVVTGADMKSFLDESVSGDTVTAYDASGAPAALQFRWAKVDTSDLGPGHKDTWNLFYQVDSKASGTDTAWQNVGTDFTFVNNQLSPPVPSVALTNVKVGDITLPNLSISFGSNLTQFSDPKGNTSNGIEANGYPAGSLQTVSIGDDGKVVGQYSNGRNVNLAQIVLATFTGANFLQRSDGGTFSVTSQSGPPVYGKGGDIQGSALEGSNADIADEFTKLIVTQQAYSANTKVITTANQMAQDLLNVVR
ncbi:flagellar hook-basal body complex protein [Bradyrhizobium sp. SYSU BS000235]|uniref:flagellar hook protein FlgE n=1 Tax=Bradyrhizobium sp. SYSU BS000235 TaxID=3411332 RepID=UPI003C78A1B5